MSSLPQTAATLDDLRRVEGKAELVAGRIVYLMPTGFRPGQVGGRIFRSLDDHVVLTGRGVALPDNVGFVVHELSSGRQSFSPDASYSSSAYSPWMTWISSMGPPTFAVEVRSKGDYGDAGEVDMAAKRADYFEAGTAVVWDVDPKSRLVRAYLSHEPLGHPTVFGPGQVADAEPAVPGCAWPLTRFSPDRISARSVTIRNSWNPAREHFSEIQCLIPRTVGRLSSGRPRERAPGALPGDQRRSRCAIDSQESSGPRDV